MEFEWKKFKALTGDETLCFEGELWIDGKKAADVSNDGNGGDCRFYWKDREIEKKVVAYVKTLPRVPFSCGGEAGSYEETVDSFIHGLACEFDADKKLRKDCSRTICFRNPGDEKGSYRLFANVPFTAVNVCLVLEKNPGIEILNYKFGKPKPHEPVWLKKVEKHCKKTICLQAPEQKPWDYSSFPSMPFTKAAVEMVKSKYPNHEILNFRFGLPS